jgi:hypothetical protein
MIEILLATLTTYAITLVISSYGGPLDVFARLRGKWNKPWSCFVCLSFWVGLLVAGLSQLTIFEYFAVVGGAILIWKVSER